MNEQEAREALAAALCEHHGGAGWWRSTDNEERDSYRNDADALMPVVRGIVARELRTVADDIRARFGWAGGYGKTLRDRADGLEATP